MKARKWPQEFPLDEWLPEHDTRSRHNADACSDWYLVRRVVTDPSHYQKGYAPEFDMEFIALGDQDGELTRAQAEFLAAAIKAYGKYP